MICTNKEFKENNHKGIRNSFLSDGFKEVYYGEFNQKSLLRLSMELSINYFEYVNTWYDDFKEVDGVVMGDPLHETWYDIEGIDYGWLCCESGDSRKNLFNLLTKDVLPFLVNEKVSIFKKGSTIVYQFYLTEQFGDYNTSITLSTTEENKYFIG